MQRNSPNQGRHGRAREGIGCYWRLARQCDSRQHRVSDKSSNPRIDRQFLPNKRLNTNTASEHRVHTNTTITRYQPHRQRSPNPQTQTPIMRQNRSSVLNRRADTQVYLNILIFPEWSNRDDSVFRNDSIPPWIGGTRKSKTRLDPCGRGRMPGAILRCFGPPRSPTWNRA